MPTYDYHCQKCDGHFEFVQSMKDKPLDICPKDKCLQRRWGKGRVKRALGTGAGLIFKGTGFYTTDYRSEGYKSAAKKDAPPSATGTSSGESKAGSSTASEASKPKTEKPAPKPSAPPPKTGGAS